ncbi:MAG: hypothetical protein WC423_19475 [Vulcanimicrobiota bacterium]
MNPKFAFVLCLLAFLLFSPSVAEEQVLATSQGYQLTESDLGPALDLLVFMSQSQLTQRERDYVVGEAIQEFQADPRSMLESLQEIKVMIQQAESTNNPMLLGEVRQVMIAEFYKMAQTMTPGEMPAYMEVLFQKAPVVAYDPHTNVALTRPDLNASVEFLNQANQFQGNDIPQAQMQMAGEELVRGFTELDVNTQKLLASGTILNIVLTSNLNTMTPQQRTDFTSHYRTTTGGPPGRTRGGEETTPEQQAAESLARDSVHRSHSLMESLRASGGSDDYWKVQNSF